MKWKKLLFRKTRERPEEPKYSVPKIKAETDCEIRTAVFGDLEAINKIDKTCFGEGAFDFGYAVDSSDYETFVAEKKGFGIVGFAAIEIYPEHDADQAYNTLIGEIPKSGVVYVMTLDVLPEFRRRGIGLKLMRAIEDASNTEIRLHVAVANEPALLLYGKSGFRKTGFRHDAYGDGKHAFLIKKELA